MGTKISVIVPTLNEEALINATLESIMDQNDMDPANYDVLVCDGGSTDNTVEIAKKLVKVLISPQKGKTYQLNFAAKKTDCDILVFVDADTCIPKNYLHSIYELYKNSKHLWACGVKFKFWLEGDWKLRLNIRLTNLFIPRYFGISKLFGYVKLPGCNIAVKRDIFLEVGGFKDLPNEDSALCTDLKNLSKKKGFGYVKYFTKPLVICSPRRIKDLGWFGFIQFYRKKEKQRFKLQKP